jgi:hypothetical protein
MAELVATYLVYALFAYSLIGALFALTFVCIGVDKVDHQAKESGWGFRILIFPGCMAFWPLFVRRWLKASGEPPEERNPHQ